MPPDPGPSIQPKLLINEGIKIGHEGREEPTPRMPQEKELQLITCSYSRNQVTSYNVRNESIKGEKIRVQNPMPQQQTEHHCNLQARCSTHCLMAESASRQGTPLVAEATKAGDEGRPQAGVPQRRAGKEVAVSSLMGEKHVLVVNMTRAREARRPWFLDVGLFLSVLLVQSRQLIDHMKEVWKMRGELEVSKLESEAGRKFVLVFSVEGDWKHATVGGPWQYKMDAFLVEGLVDGDDPSSALFTHVPMWVQFRKIPFYLLTKKLAFDLGECIGSTLSIDDSARGSISDKFVRTRIMLPLYRALRKELVLADEITGEQIVVQIRYERLPNFCLFCGFIGHMEERCDLPTTDRRIEYNLNLRVLQVHFEFPHSWLLPDAMGEASPQASPPHLWCAPTPASQELKQDVLEKGVVEQVVAEVARLAVVEEAKNSSENNQIDGGGEWEMTNKHLWNQTIKRG